MIHTNYRIGVKSGNDQQMAKAIQGLCHLIVARDFSCCRIAVTRDFERHENVP